ncbi:nicotinate-nucleotide--dimethylbenzimidazole phosphoribosyltransferase [Kyrpidia spormannii]|uniref:Nicotinate-nucleotide--dimethylbenzimidazole phosphoribosyltransferase n=2 Tax=Kyrpidia spormannii TaxID=2055160 RepID=A0A2K8N3X0_9BACL|nr:nicotinate-nucleotide--dimethylbenzimidazole phosphoribosyltransferase [Kyrpidia spormannii]
MDEDPFCEVIELYSWMSREIPLPSEKSAEAARRRLDRLTKPQGSLGRLEGLAVELAAATGEERPKVRPAGVLVMAGDHGVAAGGVSAYPPEVTAQMVLNFLRGGAAVNVLSRVAGAAVWVVDVGVGVEINPAGVGSTTGAAGSGAVFRVRKVRPGTADMTRGPAMSREEAERALDVGWSVAIEMIDSGIRLLALGEMGIGNTTAAAAVAAALTGWPEGDLVGLGTGIDPVRRQKKLQAVRRALAVNRPDPSDAVDVLSKVGGLEIAGLAGAALAGAARRVPVLMDGFIASAAVLAAVHIDSRALPYMFASHRSVEPGHGRILRWLGREPLFDLDLRLGEGTGAVLAMPMMEAAARILDEMATFEEAGVSDAEA